MRLARTPSVDAKVAFLSDPRVYREGTRRVDLVETHYAWVFLTDRFAYKLKRPMRLWPLDYRTLARRERGCRAEFALNRRLAPSVYLGVVPLVIDSVGRLRLGGAGRIVDWLVKMHRLRAHDMLDQAIVRGAVRDSELDSVARLLARFYRQATPAPYSPAAYVRRIAGRIRTNHRALAARDLGLRRDLVDAVAHGQQHLLASLAGALAARARHVVDGHGDLRPEHVCLRHPVCVIDCLEFDANLRRLDPLEEIAALVGECRALGAPGVGERLLSAFLAASGADPPRAILHFYLSHRAANRAKLAAWHLRDPKLADHGRWITRAHVYLEEAARQIDHARRLVRAGRGAASEQIRHRLRPVNALHRRPEQRRDGRHHKTSAG